MPATSRPSGPQPSNGSTVTFDGDLIGYVDTWSLEAGKAITADVTSVESEIFGTGEGTRVLRQVQAVGIEPGKLSLTLFGCPPYVVADIGKTGTLEVEFAGGSLSALAILDDFRVEASAGQLLRGQASFLLTGSVP